VTRWLVTGAAGQLGSDLQRLLAGADVTAIDLPELDLTDGPAVADFVRNWAAGGSAAGGSGPGHPLVVVNAAAWTNVDGAEEHEDTAHRVNAEVPGYLAAAGATAGATMIHISTDYVFAGDATVPYEVDAPVAPRSAYGRTKAAGERAVLDPATGSGAPAYVVRTAWVYGETGTNFVKTMVRLERERETVSVVDDQQGSPTWSRHLAAGLIELAGSNAPAGIYHCTGGGHTTWYGLPKRSSKSWAPTRRGCCPPRRRRSPGRPRARRTACCRTPPGAPPACPRCRSGGTPCGRRSHCRGIPGGQPAGPGSASDLDPAPEPPLPYGGRRSLPVPESRFAAPSRKP